INDLGTGYSFWQRQARFGDANGSAACSASTSGRRVMGGRVLEHDRSASRIACNTGVICKGPHCVPDPDPAFRLSLLSADPRRVSWDLLHEVVLGDACSDSHATVAGRASETFDVVNDRR